MAKIEPYDVVYPVKFYSGGDTTKEAFGKLIQETKRIYGVINSVNADKVSASELTDKLGEYSGNLEVLQGDLQEHINSSSPHPNYCPDFDDITGKLDGSKIKGKLPIRVVHEGDVFIDNPDETVIRIPTDKGDGITDSTLNRDGYMKFNNNLLFQWGCYKITASSNKGLEALCHVAFPKNFITQCYMVTVGTGFVPKDANSDNRGIIDTMLQSFNVSKSGFDFTPQKIGADYAVLEFDELQCNWIAIGV